MATPQIPPRPSRSQLHPSSASMGMEPPMVPPRPSNRRVDRSASPHRDSFARSPLNEIPLSIKQSSGGIYGENGHIASSSSLGLPARPPSVSLPSIGQEGSEYAYDDSETSPDQLASTLPTQTRNVGTDLPLHAPTPSLSTSNAKARIATVTRTDSQQAAAHGLGKAHTPVHGDDKDAYTRSLKARESFSSARSSASTERPSSVHAEVEQGIPEIGQRVPMYPNAGDVQAPSPSPFSQTFPAGVGYHNDGSKPRHHGRTPSGRKVFAEPPGSYGLHGHGLASPDRFEKAWYDKHPDALLREESGQYGPGIGGGRGEWALSSEDLNKIVRETASRGSGFGTSPNIVGLPNEQIGYIASEEYAMRLNSPRPQTANYHHKAHSNHSQTHVESPLRKASFPVESSDHDELNKARESHSHLKAPSEHALESETEDDEVIHVDAPEARTSKYSGNGYDPPTEDLGPHGGNTDAEGGWIEERGYGVPILASDEVAKEPGMEFLQPAVEPAQERRGSAYYAGVDADTPPFYQSGHRHSSRSVSASSSRPTSRPGSIHGTLPGLSRFTTHDDREDMHTPLEDVDEYEPLFPDDEEKKIKPSSINDRFKQRPDIKRRFPSQDIWEDAPNSLQLQATVSTPEPIEENSTDTKEAEASTVFEPPETEAARKGEVNEDEKEQLLPKEERWAKSNFKPHIRDDMQRPHVNQRFPSRDIWEDSPDSAYLQTTVDGPPDEIQSPPDDGLIAGAVVHTAGRPDEGKISGEQAREDATAGAPIVEKPSVPPRPSKSRNIEEAVGPAAHVMPSIPPRPRGTRHVLPVNMPSPLSKGSAESSPVEHTPASPVETRRAPMLPERAKPQVPVRPAKPVSRDSSEGIPLAKTLSATSVGSTSDASTAKDITSPPVPKHKPALPARPAGSKIAALKAGFMSDLDKRLQLGPQAPKVHDKPVEDEKEEEKAPLTDARKSRAKGPTRRKPATSPAAQEASESSTIKLEIVAPWTLWHIPTDGDGALQAVHATSRTKAQDLPEPPATKAATPTEAAEESEHVVHETTRNAEQEVSHKTQDAPKQQPSAATAPSAASTNIDSSNLDGADDTAAIAQPAESEFEPAPPSSETTSTAIQTGEKNIVLDSASEAPTKITAYEGGLAQSEGDALVRKVAEVEGEHHTEATEV